MELFSRIFRNLGLQRDETNLWYPSRMYVLHEIPSFQKLGRKNRPNFLQKNNKTPMTKRRSLSLFSCRYTNKRSTKRKMHKTKIPQTNPNPKKNLGLEKNQQEDEGKKKKNKQKKQYHYQGASIHCCLSRQSQNVSPSTMESDEEEVACLKLYTEKLGFMHPSEKSSKFLIVFFLFLKIFFLGFCGDSVKHVE